MRYVWNENKARRNFQKHNIDFADAVIVFEDTNAITIEDRDHEEERFVTLGVDAYNRLLIVVYIYLDNDFIRVISARKANKIEQRFYNR